MFVLKWILTCTPWGAEFRNNNELWQYLYAILSSTECAICKYSTDQDIPCYVTPGFIIVISASGTFCKSVRYTFRISATYFLGSIVMFFHLHQRFPNCGACPRGGHCCFCGGHELLVWGTYLLWTKYGHKVKYCVYYFGRHFCLVEIWSLLYCIF
jgi:hypothetical protein